MAAFLSSFRVFTDLINAKKMDESTQDRILHLIHVISKFPPALRTAHILMQGKSPRPEECAALAQTLFETIKDIVPLELVESNECRVLEGSRLLFGFLIAKAKQLSTLGDSSTPYLHSFSTIDLLNAETRQPVVSPVATSIGLVEEGFYKACREGGILNWPNCEGPLEARPIDEQTQRLVLLHGGLQSDATALDWGLLDRFLEPGTLESLDKTQAFSNLSSLVANCECNGLAILSPSALPSSEAPALTLDRDCLNAVYVRRTPCGEPGKE